RVLVEPTPDLLWRLHPHLLALDTPEAESAREVARTFYAYLSCVKSKLTAKQYSTLAAVFAAGAVGALATQEMIEALRDDPDNAIRHLLVGGVAQGLEVLATIQHIKAWEAEFVFSHEDVVWALYEHFWRLSAETQPELDAAARHALIDSLLGVVRSAVLGSGARVAMVIKLFQVLLLMRLVPLTQRLAADEASK
ncbi:MAG: hypothetical protein K8S97_03735, partial [Anaerolineae bacterium]|nr:hypothetical protein [Anaerolineae bacterium]